MRRGPRSRAAAVGSTASRRPVIRNRCISRTTPPEARLLARSARTERARDAVRGGVVEERLGRGDPRAEAVEGEPEDRRAHLLAVPLALERRPGRRPGPILVRVTASRSAWTVCSRSVRHRLDQQVQTSRSKRPRGVAQPVVLGGPSLESGLGTVDQATPNGIAERWMPAVAERQLRPGRRPSGGRTGQAFATQGQHRGQADSIAAPMGGRRYTPGMGAVETMEEFFGAQLGEPREAAVALMDERDRDARPRRGQRSDPARRGARRRLVPARRRGPADDPRRDPRHRHAWRVDLLVATGRPDR